MGKQKKKGQVTPAENKIRKISKRLLDTDKRTTPKIEQKSNIEFKKQEKCLMCFEITMQRLMPTCLCIKIHKGSPRGQK